MQQRHLCHDPSLVPVRCSPATDANAGACHTRHGGTTPESARILSPSEPRRTGRRKLVENDPAIWPPPRPDDLPGPPGSGWPSFAGSDENSFAHQSVTRLSFASPLASRTNAMVQTPRHGSTLPKFTVTFCAGSAASHAQPACAETRRRARTAARVCF